MGGEILGLIPVAGHAVRMGPLPCSKEILPIGIWAPDGTNQVKVACHFLLERMRVAQVSRILLILREGKEDIPSFLADGGKLGLELEYVTVDSTPGPLFTLDRAYTLMRGSRIVFGFPDILFEPRDAFHRLLQKQAATGADVVLGLFPTDRPKTMDMVKLDMYGGISRIDIKPPASDLSYTWIIAVWTPAFTEFVHAFVAEVSVTPHESIELRASHVGAAIEAALASSLRVDSVVFPVGACLDIGCLEDYMAAIRYGGQLGATAHSKEEG